MLKKVILITTLLHSLLNAQHIIIDGDEGSSFNSDGYAKVFKGELMAFMNTEGKLVSKFILKNDKYAQKYNTYSKYGYVVENNHRDYSIINNEGDVVVKFPNLKYDYCSQFEDNSFFLASKHDYKIKKTILYKINALGKEVKQITIPYDGKLEFGYLNKGRYLVNGFYDGEMIVDSNLNIKAQLKHIQYSYDDHSNFILVQGKNSFGEEKWGILSKDGKFVLDYKFTNQPTNFRNNYALVKDKEGYISIIDTNGTIVLDTKEKYVSEISEKGRFIVSTLEYKLLKDLKNNTLKDLSVSHKNNVYKLEDYSKFGRYFDYVPLLDAENGLIFRNTDYICYRYNLDTDEFLVLC